MGNTLTGRTVYPVTTEAGSLVQPTASVFEIFKSRQGEGLLVGDPHIFIRLGGCNLVCDYCDTPDSIPFKSGKELDLETVLARVDELSGEDPAPTVSLTGGEPLAQVAFLEELLPRLRARGAKIYLETNGTLPKALAKVVDHCDWIAMDFKPESSTGRDLWEAHRWFLEIAGNKAFVKMVLTDQTSEAEFRRGVELIALLRPAMPLVLQPATAQAGVQSIPLARLTVWWAWAAQRLKDVRICPQIHRLWGIA
jgi:organic radical activating enzyme